MYTTKQHRSRAKKNLLVSTRPNGTRKYRKARVREETTRPRGPKNILPFVLDDDRNEYNQPSYELLDGLERDSLQAEFDYYGPEGECQSRQFVFDPVAARERSTISVFDLLPVGDQQIVNEGEYWRDYKRKKAARKDRIQRLGGVRFTPATKTHDGLLPERNEAARFINRVLGQTGERGQGYMKNAQNSWGEWVVNSYSWSPQMAWSAIPDQLKFRTAPLIVDFFRRWKDALAGNLTKTEVLQWGDLEVGKTAVLKTVPRGKLQILPGGGCDIALRPREGAHRLWVDKMANSPTVRGLQRMAYPSLPGCFLQTMAVYGKAAKTIQTTFRKWLKKRQFEAEMEEFRIAILREPATIRIQRWWNRWSKRPSGVDPRVRRRLLESDDAAEN